MRAKQVDLMSDKLNELAQSARLEKYPVDSRKKKETPLRRFHDPK